MQTINEIRRTPPIEPPAIIRAIIFTTRENKLQADEIKLGYDIMIFGSNVGQVTGLNTEILWT